MTYPVSPVTCIVTVGFRSEVVHHCSGMSDIRGDGHAVDDLLPWSHSLCVWYFQSNGRCHIIRQCTTLNVEHQYLQYYGEGSQKCLFDT